jgi:hypothetical protein
MNKLKTLTTLLFSCIIAAILIPACGEDSAPNNGGTGGGGGWHPNLNFSQGQIFVYSNDSLHAQGGGHTFTGVRTTSTIQAQTTYQGQQCYPVTGVNYDSTPPPTTTPDLPYWIRYDQSSGKLYQYGIQQLINPGLPGSWDVVGDFDVARGTEYNIASINYTVLIPGIGNVTFTGPLKGKIADSTTIQTTRTPPETIPCYRIELTASVTASGNIGATVIIDYYIGYGTPPNGVTGIVELKLRPFSFNVAGTPFIYEPGHDRKLYSHTP